jgi:hypothetical protein
MQSSFSDGAVVRTANGAIVPVITQVSLNDTSTSLSITQLTASHGNQKNYFSWERNATTFTYETPASDVPRLLDSRVSAQNW